MIVLGIETSCDDTGVALVKADFAKTEKIAILSNVTAGQNDFHRDYGGVVPEVAARKHVEFILPVMEKSLKDAGVTLNEVDAIAVTTHPGLIGSLFVGVGCAQTLAYLTGKPLVAVSHLKAHFFSVPLDTEIAYPFIGLLISGGHTLLARCESPLKVEVLGSTHDDACGECFDKVAKHFKLGYPGGPAIERTALNDQNHQNHQSGNHKGNPDAYDFPQPQFRRDHSGYAYNFSFSGLKTAVIHHNHKYLKKKSSGEKKEDICLPDLAASLQKNIVKTLWRETMRAAEDFGIPRIGICGGVAANRYLRETIKPFKQSGRYQVFFPQMSLCTDNAAMIAGLGCHYLREGLTVADITALRPSAQAFKKDRIL